jgi:hypothetical protein
MSGIVMPGPYGAHDPDMTPARATLSHHDNRGILLCGFEIEKGRAESCYVVFFRVDLHFP